MCFKFICRQFKCGGMKGPWVCDASLMRTLVYRALSETARQPNLPLSVRRRTLGSPEVMDRWFWYSRNVYLVPDFGGGPTYCFVCYSVAVYPFWQTCSVPYKNCILRWSKEYVFLTYCFLYPLFFLPLFCFFFLSVFLQFFLAFIQSFFLPVMLSITLYFSFLVFNSLSLYFFCHLFRLFLFPSFLSLW
jgi:hypothetical protein